ERIDFVFDSYIQGSVKDSERECRSTRSPLIYTNISNDTKLPKEMDLFWPANANKAKLQALISRWLVDNIPEKAPQVSVFLSKFVGEGTEVSP
ncbi:MAG: hypothetical protein MJA29_06805, partial [Candidatus Omnitrophica bacterium]|nr:hypothetical protein [Candidatus Omnitrophota bacterium]